MTSILLALLAVILLAVGLYGYFRWFGVLDRPEGERYQRRRMPSSCTARMAWTKHRWARQRWSAS